MIGKAALGWVDAFFGRVPVINSVYTSTRQVVDVFRSGKRQLFTNPVLAEYPSPGIWSLGFNTGEMEDAGILDGGKRYTIFIPQTPPTGGFLAVLSEKQIRRLNISAEDAIKMILTGGMVKKESPGVKK
jgi:uncharacterized membrane protein